MASLQQPPTRRAPTSPSGSPAATLDEPPSGGLRVLQIAFACHPHESMETRIGWWRALHAARRHHVTVLHGEPRHTEELTLEAAAAGLSDRLRFVAVDHGPLGAPLSRSATTYYLGLRKWHRNALKVARRLHREAAFDLVHQTTFCGFREPGDGWSLGAPFVWGPVGGTQSFPMAYLGELGLREAWIELTRNVINSLQLRCSPRVRHAIRHAAVLVAATNKAAGDIQRASGRRPPVQLETALDIPVGPPRQPRAADEPFRILWAGRLRAWKTLPLLLKALPLLPADLDWRLDVLGVGKCERSWKRLAQRLGLENRVRWHGWPGYRRTLPFYQQADAFAFTSMRDTSGTGLLEALAAGTPIVGVDHQGAADIMTPDCALPVAVGRPQETIDRFAERLTNLASDPELWRRLSGGARREAERHAWQRQASTLLDWYADAVHQADAPAPTGGSPVGSASRPCASPAKRVHAAR